MTSRAPAFPVVIARGRTEEEAIENIRDAIREYVGALPELKSNQKLIEVDVAS